jgi:hypothetical protein
MNILTVVGQGDGKIIFQSKQVLPNFLLVREFHKPKKLYYIPHTHLPDPFSNPEFSPFSLNVV